MTANGIFIGVCVVVLALYIAWAVWADVRATRDRREYMATALRQNAVSDARLRESLLAEMRKSLRAEGIEPTERRK